MQTTEDKPFTAETSACAHGRASLSDGSAIVHVCSGPEGIDEGIILAMRMRVVNKIHRLASGWDTLPCRSYKRSILAESVQSGRLEAIGVHVRSLVRSPSGQSSCRTRPYRFPGVSARMGVPGTSVQTQASTSTLSSGTAEAGEDSGLMRTVTARAHLSPAGSMDLYHWHGRSYRSPGGYPGPLP
jgi:hypothetical protein